LSTALDEFLAGTATHVQNRLEATLRARCSGFAFGARPLGRVHVNISLILVSCLLFHKMCNSDEVFRWTCLTTEDTTSEARTHMTFPTGYTDFDALAHTPNSPAPSASRASMSPTGFIESPHHCFRRPQALHAGAHAHHCQHHFPLPPMPSFVAARTCSDRNSVVFAAAVRLRSLHTLSLTW
jgi:hypothetical protein